MSNLSYLEKLLGGVDVEWLPLGNLAEIGTGKSNRQDETEDGEYPFYVRSKNILRSDTFQFDETAIVVPGEGGIGDIFHFVEGKYALHQRAYRIKATSDVLDTKFLYHYMYSKFKQYILMKSVGATSVSIRKPMLEGFQIPIPCPDNPEKSLVIQAEIVRILDSFTAMTTELTAELTAELNMRKKQYNYYRDQLLSFEEGEVEWKMLGEIGEFIRGKRFTKKDYVEDDGIKVIHYGEIYTHYGTSSTIAISQVRSDLAGSLRYAEPNDVIVASVGETIDEVAKAVAWLGDEKVAIHDDSYAIRHSLNPKYLSYCLQTEKFTTEKAKHVSSGKVKRLLINGISKMEVPIPFADDPEKSLAEQSRIVAILDKFDALTNSITEGLSREIELRQKQYEYYRDLLLSFPKSNEGAA
ncbi:TPA: restriction endonuclease subunit S [Vibrio parahaemolyticus]|uniref:restriction endonuclease subunit S n=1 Tax=Vibrio parahaemolyticus TaxID=670 RepID=UPI0004A243FB|nr:restriction endonuclease subunit S [Vibrio parahaemolyticus]KYY55609.1 restriction endonuclease subunit S [Vibrio parahaemolyticus]OKY45199.1 restriction endonuclease subunit S [Vibrio parahaemolyticus]HCE2583248.1 restriction endonuclease subunit S [Vibrio parahaemolyticus]HCE2729858.1 restriction endonuclease subunit S [Vibrio parahaemolyticus]HCE2812748.1 restriction endonuclease subunit S [Vibrio parahaemolyticus]